MELKSIIVKFIFFALGITAAIVAAYLWVLPVLFNHYKTYSVFIMGLLCTGILGGYYCYNILELTLPTSPKLILSVLGGILTSLVVALLSLFIILNIHGCDS